MGPTGSNVPDSRTRQGSRGAILAPYSGGLVKVRRWLVVGVALAATTALAACAPPSSDSDSSDGGSGGVDAKSATSAEDFGGMDALVEAAEKEGTLNVIALPPDWANYGNI